MEPTAGTETWYAQVTAGIIEPERPIVDPITTCSLAENGPTAGLGIYGVIPDLGTKSFRDQREASYQQWPADIVRLMVTAFSDDQKHARFYGTAEKIYRLEVGPARVHRAARHCAGIPWLPSDAARAWEWLSFTVASG